MTFKAVLRASRVTPYWHATEKQIEAIQSRNYKLAYLYNCYTWLKLFNSREADRKIQAWKYAIRAYKFYINTPTSL